MMHTRLAGRWSRCMSRLWNLGSSSGSAVSGEVRVLPPCGGSTTTCEELARGWATARAAAVLGPRVHLPSATGSTCHYDSVTRVTQSFAGTNGSSKPWQSIVKNACGFSDEDRVVGSRKPPPPAPTPAPAPALAPAPAPAFVPATSFQLPVVANLLRAFNVVPRTGPRNGTSTRRRGFSSKVKKTKLKAYSSYKERFRLLADGTFVRRKAGKRHNAHSKTAKQRRQLRKPTVVAAGHTAPLRKLAFSK